MTTLLAFGLANAVFAALLAIPAYLVGRYGKRPALAHALWLLVLLKLVTPPVFQPALPWLPAVSAPQKAKPLENNAGHPVSLVLASENPTMAPGGEARLLPLAPDAEPTIPLAGTGKNFEVPGPNVNLESMFMAAWLVGAIWCLGWTVRQTMRFQYLLRFGRPAPADFQGLAEELAQSLGLQRCPEVWLVPGQLPPMVWGLGRLRILFPVGLMERLGTEERKSLLAHELAHVGRRDHWVRWLELTATTVYWWNPIVWWARNQMQAREEECCDAWAVQCVAPGTYASAILDTVDFLSEARQTIPTVASPLSRVKSLRCRLTLILTGATPQRLPVLIRGMLVALSFALLPLVPRLVQAEPDSRSADSTESHDQLEPNEKWASIRYSPDGGLLATSLFQPGRPGQIEIWNAQTRELLLKPRVAVGGTGLDFAAGGNQLVWSGQGGELESITLSDKKIERLPLVGRAPARFNYSRDGKWLVAATGRSLELFDARVKQLAYSVNADTTSFSCVTISPDSKFVVAGGGSIDGRKANQLLIFDLQSKQHVVKVTGHSRTVLNVAIAPRNRFIATASADRTVNIFDGSSLRLLNTLRGYGSGVKGLAFSPTGDMLATRSRDKGICLWNPVTGRQIGQVEGPGGVAGDLTFSPDGKSLVWADGVQGIKVWDVVKQHQTTLQRPGRLAPQPVVRFQPIHLVVTRGE